MTKNESLTTSPVTSGLCETLSCKTNADSPVSPISQPRAPTHALLPVCVLPPQTIALLRKHFWTDFADVIPSMAWDDSNVMDVIPD